MSSRVGRVMTLLVVVMEIGQVRFELCQVDMGYRSLERWISVDGGNLEVLF